MVDCIEYSNTEYSLPLFSDGKCFRLLIPWTTMTSHCRQCDYLLIINVGYLINDVNISPEGICRADSCQVHKPGLETHEMHAGLQSPHIPRMTVPTASLSFVLLDIWNDSFALHPNVVIDRWDQLWVLSIDVNLVPVFVPLRRLIGCQTIRTLTCS